jgi:hypothetical protein
MRKKYRFMMSENRAPIGFFRFNVQKVIGEYSSNNKLLKQQWRSTQNFSQKTLKARHQSGYPFIYGAQGMGARWWALVNSVMNLQVP